MSNKLKILCIHGYRQNAESFKEKLGAFRKLMKTKAEFSFVNAPFRVGGEDEFGWWFSRSDDSFDALENSDYCKGYVESLNLVCQFVKDNGPFDGLLGFSQGASFVALLCILAHRRELPFSIKFAVIIAGFKSRCTLHSNIYDVKVTIPTMQIFGENDKVIPKETSQELTELFEKPTLVIHSGGHFLPVTSAQKQIYLDFLEKNK